MKRVIVILFVCLVFVAVSTVSAAAQCHDNSLNFDGASVVTDGATVITDGASIPSSDGVESVASAETPKLIVTSGNIQMFSDVKTNLGPNTKIQIVTTRDRQNRWVVSSIIKSGEYGAFNTALYKVTLMCDGAYLKGLRIYFVDRSGSVKNTNKVEEIIFTKPMCVAIDTVYNVSVVSRELRESLRFNFKVNNYGALMLAE